MVIYYMLYSRPPDLRLGHDMYDNISLRCLYVKMADLVLAQVMDDGIGTTLLNPCGGEAPRSALSIHEIRQLGIPDHPPASLSL